MRNLREFSTIEEYQEAELVYPAVSLIASGTVIYDKSEPTPPPPTPTFQGKWLATYSDSHTESAECGSSSSITQYEIDATDLVSVEIGNCVEDIEYSAFRDCYSLTSVTIGSGVTSIGSQAFYNCSSLTNIDIPSSVRTIGESAFNDAFGDWGADPTADVVIGSGVTYIGSEAFSASAIREVTIYATTPPEIGMNVFDELAGGVRILVPNESVSAYKSAEGWSDYADRIQAIQ